MVLTTSQPGSFADFPQNLHLHTQRAHVSVRAETLELEFFFPKRPHWLSAACEYACVPFCGAEPLLYVLCTIVHVPVRRYSSCQLFVCISYQQKCPDMSAPFVFTVYAMLKQQLKLSHVIFATFQNPKLFKKLNIVM